MYRVVPDELSPEHIADLLRLSAQTDLAPGPGGSRITPTPLGPVLDAVGCVEGRATAAAFVALYPSAQLVAHRDPPIQGIRVHYPLIVNDGCWVFHDGVWAQLEVGKGYEMNPAEVHGAVNWGAERRVHLILDLCPHFS